MRAAEGTAEWRCEENGIRCKWHYADVVLAEMDDCADLFAGKNHKELAQAARASVLRLRRAALQQDQVYAQWLIKLEDAQVRAKQARDARHAVTAPVLADKDYRMSAESMAAADATLAGMRDQARLIGQRTARNILNTKITVVPHEHA
jgi:hypothetical protein